MSLEKEIYQQMSKHNNDFKLTPDQEKAYQLISKGENIFLTGQAGVGKSLIIKLFRHNFSQVKNIGITSTTGISAILVNGSTVHSFLGIGLGTSSAQTLATKLSHSAYYRKRWRQLETLIIDEVSMLSPNLFDKLEEIARTVRENKSPFGGIQLILSGDFCQLPVVGENKFCFEAKSWDKCIQHTIYLKDILRQTDPVFQKCLSEIRMGYVSHETKQILSSRLNATLANDHGIKPTRLFPTNMAVDRLNEDELDLLADDGKEFKQYDMETQILSFSKPHVIEKYKKNCIAPPQIQLCVGAQVMLLYNLDTSRKLANGSRGIVVKFVDDFPVVRFLSGEEVVIDYHVWDIEENGHKILRITQIPLKLAWALTIHKSQGATLDYAEIDIENVFEYGQAYCALSRVKDLEGLSIHGLDFDRIKAHPKAVEYYSGLE